MQNEINKIDKTPTFLSEMDVVWKMGTDILKPVILVAGSLPVDSVNYVYLEEFKRWYFVTNIKTVRSSLYELNLSVDVLYTYRESIKNLEVVTARQENSYNTYLNDNEFTVYNNTFVQQKTFPSGFNTNPSYYLCVAGGDE